MGYSSLTQYIDAIVDEAFATTKTNTYSFSTDGTALFLEEALPANNGTNELSGQTYNGVTYTYDTGTVVTTKDPSKVYVFTATSYTFTGNSDGYTQTETGSYTYNTSYYNNMKVVYFRPSTINGKNRVQYYAEQTAYSGHYFVDDNAYRAAQTNSYFYTKMQPYNSTNKTIGYEY